MDGENLQALTSWHRSRSPSTHTCKLNLFRRRLSQHNIQSSTNYISLHDSQLSLSCIRDCPLSLIDQPTFTNLDDLNNLHAARTLQEASNTHDKGADIVLHQRIPVGGGLGGGSADAAATLVALNRLWDLGLSRAELATLGGRLGADIPVLMLGHSALAEAQAKKTSRPSPCPIASSSSYIRLFVPPQPHIHPDLVRSTPAVARADYDSGRAKTWNDLQLVAEALYPPSPQPPSPQPYAIRNRWTGLIID